LTKGKRGGIRCGNDQATDKSRRAEAFAGSALRTHREVGKVSIVELQKQKILGARPRIF
jgi:hypothetical protein